jgi:DNA topoisomerase-1
LGLENGGAGEAGDGADAGPRELGVDSQTGLAVTLRKGPYGHYVQLGEGDEGEKPKRASLPKGLSPAAVDLERALKLLALPREVGRHPETGETITAGIGRFGPYIKHGKTFKSIGADDDVLTIGLNRAVSLLAEPKSGRGAPQPLRILGEHPEDGAAVTVFKGRYGPYVSHGGVNATLPRDLAPEDVTLDRAIELLAAQKAKGKPAKGRGTAKGSTRAKTGAAKTGKAGKKGTAKAESEAAD